MTTLVSYGLESSIATIAMDDGKVNALSPEMFVQLNRALDQAEADRAPVVLTGRQGVFSAGFSLPVLRAGGPDAVALLRAGFDLATRLLAFPAPVVIACNGHAIAMGLFLLLSGDYRIGASGAFKLTANEVAIGMTLPYAAIEICRQRLTPAHLHRVVTLAEPYTPDDGIAAGLVDRVVAPGELPTVARAVATQLLALDRGAFAATKQRLREPTMAALRAALAADDRDVPPTPAP